MLQAASPSKVTLACSVNWFSISFLQPWTKYTVLEGPVSLSQLRTSSFLSLQFTTRNTFVWWVGRASMPASSKKRPTTWTHRGAGYLSVTRTGMTTRHVKFARTISALMSHWQWTRLASTTRSSVSRRRTCSRTRTVIRRTMAVRWITSASAASRNPGRKSRLATPILKAWPQLTAHEVESIRLVKNLVREWVPLKKVRKITQFSMNCGAIFSVLNA